jgi:hypothetical protein
MLARRANSSGEWYKRSPACDARRRRARDLDGQRGQSMHELLRRRGGGAWREQQRHEHCDGGDTAREHQPILKYLNGSLLLASSHANNAFCYARVRFFTRA